MADKKESGRFGARLLIILYGLGIVLIGAYPIQKEYGSLLDFLKQGSADLLSTARFEQWSRPRIGEPEVRRLSVSRASLGSKGAALDEKDKDLDKLTKSDRSELNNLFNDLEP